MSAIFHAPRPTSLQWLEWESMHILREIVAECRHPVMLYSIGKDSSVLLHLARKAFHPAPLPFPLLHIDTGWKFREMITHRDRIARRFGLDLIVHHDAASAAAGIDPFRSGAEYTRIMKTEALKTALSAGGFDAAFGGARRDEEKSRAKERVVSVRDAGHGWDPKRQRPEFWRLYNPRVPAGESVRVFPLSNWTETDIWQYIARENIELVPLYFAKPRPTVQRDGAIIVADDDRMVYAPGEAAEMRMVRFRSIGCYPLTGAVLSDAATLDAVVAETAAARDSERATRLVDRETGSMEQKKREGYF